MKPLKIMIVEDEMLNALYLQEILKYKGYEVVGKAASGEDAIQLALKLNPSIILMDIMLNGKLNGIDTVKEIHKTKYIPIIYITASTENTTYEKAKETKMIDYLYKPVMAEKLYSCIEKAANL